MTATAERATQAVEKGRAQAIRIRGLVQGVGFRPTIWRLARELGLHGWVANDGTGVLIHVGGAPSALDAFADRLVREAPPLARIEAVERESLAAAPSGSDFRILESRSGPVHTGVVPDAASCPACVAEVSDPGSRRYRYPFTNCTHCGPRLSIIDSVPYDRATTTMRAFGLCEACTAEYADPADRRFHAQPMACPHCGPQVWLERADGSRVASEALGGDPLEAAATLLQRGEIVAVKGLGGFQLACDAENEHAVTRLRERKRRWGKPFALMARDVEVIRRYAAVDDVGARLLQSPAAPIVLLAAAGTHRVAAAVAPRIRALGFMLPSTPLHHLLLARMPRPIVLTSGNVSDEPQCIDNDEARIKLARMADFFLMHDRGIAQRVDDSVIRVAAGDARIVRRARGYAPAPLPLPPGFESAPAVLAFGADLKSTCCLVRDGQAIVSHHIGDLEDAATQADYRRALARYAALFEHRPSRVVVDLHPGYHSRRLAEAHARDESLPIERVQHHHAHIAACLAENEVPLRTPPVLGIALDGLGFGADGALWGGEFLLADYIGFRRLASFKPVAMLGGELANREPWRNTYAHLMATIGWARLATDFRDLELVGYLQTKPRNILDRMLARGINSPRASSCGRLFDAVAAAIGICRDAANYEGQAAAELEAAVDERALREEDALAYPFALSETAASGLLEVDPQPMWQALLRDLRLGTPTGIMATRFHKGLAVAIARVAEHLAPREAVVDGVPAVALSGGVFQNAVLLAEVKGRLEQRGFAVLTHRRVPANDGGISLGQAVIAAARAVTGA